jgi:hypothetical protein
MMGFLIFLGVWIVCEFFIPKFLNYTSFLLLDLLCGLGGGAGNILGGGGFDDTDSNSLPHVSARKVKIYEKSHLQGDALEVSDTLNRQYNYYTNILKLLTNP